MSQLPDEDWDIEIRPKSSLFDLHLKDTWHYRDLAFVVTFGVPLLMYTTTVIYPLSAAVTKYPAYSWLIKFNPITTVIETLRYGFLGKGSLSWELLGYSTGVTVVILLMGIIIFNKVEKTFVDTV